MPASGSASLSPPGGRDALIDKKLIEADNDVYCCIDPEMRIAINLSREERDKRDVT